MLRRLHQVPVIQAGIRRVCSQVGSAAVSKFLASGQASTSRRFTSQDITAFANVTEDRNPIHISEEAANQVGLSGPVVHGALLNGLVSALIAASLPNCVVLTQDLNFPQALLVGEEVTVVLQLISHRKRFVCVKYTCRNPYDAVVMHGEAKLALMNNKQGTESTK